jgi:hypothetical protein
VVGSEDLNDMEGGSNLCQILQKDSGGRLTWHLLRECRNKRRCSFDLHSGNATPRNESSSLRCHIGKNMGIVARVRRK